MRPKPIKVQPEEGMVACLAGLDRQKVCLKVNLMPTLATKTSEAFARQVQHAAAARKTTVSSFIHKAIENELAGRPAETFGQKFGHLFGAGGNLPSDASMKEGYED